MESDPASLRRQAARWRKIAVEYDERTAKALIEAAESLEDRAAAIEGEHGTDGGCKT